MGYKLPKRTAKVAFDVGHDYHGLEVELSLSVPVAQTFEMERLAKNASENAEQLVRAFVDAALVKWNVEDDNDVPIPVTPDAVLAHITEDVLLELFTQWREVRTVPAPLEQPSSDTDTSAPVQLMRTVSG